MKRHLIIIGAALLLKRTVNTTVTTKQAYKNITVKPRSIKNISVSTKRIKFDTDLELKNNSEKNIRINQGVLSYIERVDFYLENQYIGFATPTIQDIEIPAYGQFRMRNITVEVPLNTALDLIKNGNINVDRLTVRTHISAAGQTIII